MKLSSCCRRSWSSSTLRVINRSLCWRTTLARHAASRSSSTNTSGSLSRPTMTWREPKGWNDAACLTDRAGSFLTVKKFKCFSGCYCHNCARGHFSIATQGNNRVSGGLRGPSEPGHRKERLPGKRAGRKRVPPGVRAAAEGRSSR